LSSSLAPANTNPWSFDFGGASRWDRIVAAAADHLTHGDDTPSIHRAEPSLDTITARTADPDPDASLVARIIGANETDAHAAFESLFRSYYSPLLGFASAYIHDVAVAEEVVCDVFTWLWTRRCEWHPSTTIRAYLHAAVRHRALNVKRAAHRDDARAATLSIISDQATHTTVAAVDDRLDLEARTRAIHAALATLSHRARTILGLRYGNGLSSGEIAQIVGISMAAVDQELSRARRAIRSAIPNHLK